MEKGANPQNAECLFPDKYHRLRAKKAERRREALRKSNIKYHLAQVFVGEISFFIDS